MEDKKFESPREEALEIAYKTRRDILEGKKDAISILRACLVIARNLNKKEDEKWILSELSGYKSEEVPNYRIIYCPYEVKGVYKDKLRKFNIPTGVHILDSFLKRDKNLRLIISDAPEIVAIIDPMKIERIMSRLIDRCLFFLNDVITELQYGGATQYFIEEIRKETDEKLSKLNPNITYEINSLYINLTSNNPADWPKVAHSCRRILKFVADIVFPAQEESYKMRDGRELQVKDPHFINRIMAFLDQKLSGNERGLIIAEIGYLENYLRKVVDFTQTGEHAESISKFTASLIATHTYLILSEILRVYDATSSKATKELREEGYDGK